MKIFSLGKTKTVPPIFDHAHQGDHFNIHIDEKNGNVQIYRHADFKQLPSKEAVTYLLNLAAECTKIANGIRK